jgi:hypothetical protein
MILRTHSQYVAASQVRFDLVLLNRSPGIASSFPHPISFVPIPMRHKAYAFVIAVPNVVIQRHVPQHSTKRRGLNVRFCATPKTEKAPLQLIAKTGLANLGLAVGRTGGPIGSHLFEGVCPSQLHARPSYRPGLHPRKRLTNERIAPSHIHA